MLAHQAPTPAAEPLPSVGLLGTIYTHHLGFVKNGLKGATCAICSNDPKQLGEYFDSTQGFRGHTQSGAHKSRAEAAWYSSGTFAVGGVACCVACNQQLAASEVASHQATRAHGTALALWAVTDDQKISGKKRKQVAAKKQCTSAPEPTACRPLVQPHRQGPGAQFAVPPLGEETFIELGLQEHRLLWERIGDFMRASLILSRAQDAAVKGDLAQARACFGDYIATISSLLQAANPPSLSGPAPLTEGEVHSLSVPVNTSQLEDKDAEAEEEEGGEEPATPGLDTFLANLENTLAGNAEMDLEQILSGQQQTIEPKAVEGDAEDESAVQQLLSLCTIQDEGAREHDIAAIVRLGVQAAQMLTIPGYIRDRLSTNGLLAALGVPKNLHFPEDPEDRLAHYFQIKAWLALKRGDFTCAVFGVCSNLLVMINLPDDHPIMDGERADLARFLRRAEPRFRPHFVRLWQAALPRLHGWQKHNIIQGLIKLLEQEAKWYDQHSE